MGPPASNSERSCCSAVTGFLALLLIGLLLLPGIARTQQHKDAFERATRTIETLTDKAFDKPVTIKSQSRDAFQKYLQKQLKIAFSDGELDAYANTYQLLGLLPDNYNLHKELLDLYRSQAGAYYDPSTKAIRTLGGDLPKSQAYFVYLHELVHAHQDQHYDLLGQRRQRALESYDSMTAFNFVIEGHANLLTMASQLGVSKLNEQYFSSQRHLGVFRLLTRFTSIDLSQLKVVEQIAGSSQLTQNLKMMRNTPDILIKQMIDPYFWGQFYWYERASQTSWKTTLEWLSDPPSETRRLIYRDLNSSAGATTLDEGRFDSTFSASMGVYFLLRWLQKLDARPDWGRSLRADRLHLINTGDDSYLAWELLFGETERAGQFVRSLLHNNSDDTTTTLAREHGTAHLTVQKQNNTVLLYIEDDPESEDYDSSQ